MIYVVIGLGEFGRSAAVELQSLGNKVIGIDLDAKEAELISEVLEHVVIADATDIHTLENINVAQSDGVLVSIGDDLEASLLCVVNLQSLGVENIWVKAKNDAHHCILTSLGVQQIVHPEREMGLRIAQKMNTPDILDYMVLAKNKFLVKLLASNTTIGKKINQLSDKNINIDPIMLIRGEKMILIVEEDLIIEAGDCLLCLGYSDALKLFNKLSKDN